MSQAQDNSNDPLHAKKKAWSGRFSEPVDAFVLRYTASVDFDKRMALVDIDGSVAHATMLAKVGVISEQDLADIKRGMAQIREEIQTGKFEWQLELEDVHLNIEARLTALIGDAGKRLPAAPATIRLQPISASTCAVKSTKLFVVSSIFRRSLSPRLKRTTTSSCLALRICRLLSRLRSATICLPMSKCSNAIMPV